MAFYYRKSIHFEAQGAGRRLTGGGDMATGLCSKCVTVDKSSSQGDDRRERPWGVEVGSDFAKWPRAIIKAYILKRSKLLL